MLVAFVDLSLFYEEVSPTVPFSYWRGWFGRSGFWFCAK